MNIQYPIRTPKIHFNVYSGCGIKEPIPSYLPAKTNVSSRPCLARGSRERTASNTSSWTGTRKNSGQRNRIDHISVSLHHKVCLNFCPRHMNLQARALRHEASICFDDVLSLLQHDSEDVLLYDVLGIISNVTALCDILQQLGRALV